MSGTHQSYYSLASVSHLGSERITLVIITAVTAVMMLASCSDNSGMMPPSGGRLYEVLLVGDNNGIVKKALQEDVPGLPQGEPQFDVSSITQGKFNQSVNVSRNIVIVNVDPDHYTSANLSFEKDVWAHPQIVININTPSMAALRQGMSSIAPALLRLLNRSETNKYLSILRQKRNFKAEKVIKKRFGIDIWIPFDMTSSRVGKGFLWLSNNSPTLMRNIVIYTNCKPTIGSSSDTRTFCLQRDSALGRNIKGETDSMEMRTVTSSVVSELAFRRGSDRLMWLKHEHSDGQMRLFRGLWEMTGDDMGGPFVSREVVARGKTANTCITVEGFVFAPGKKKRNAIRQLEGVLYTITETK